MATSRATNRPREFAGLLAAALLVGGCGTAADDDVAAPSAPAVSEELVDSAPSDVPSDLPSDVPEVSGMCAQGEPDCDDMVEVPPSVLPTEPTEPGGGAAGACLAGATECADDPSLGLPPPGPPTGTEVDPHEGLVDVEPTPWISIVPIDDEQQRTLQVSWQGGNEACYGLDRAEVEESEGEVVVTVFTGREPGDLVCTQEVVVKSTTVTLSEPLGPRSIRDGAPGGTGGLSLAPPSD